MRTFDLHADTMIDIGLRRLQGEQDVIRNHHLDNYRRGDMGGMIYALWTPTDMDTLEDFHIPKVADSAQELMMQLMAHTFRELHDTDCVEIGYTADDMERIADSGKTAILLGFEGFYGFNGEVDMIDMIFTSMSFM